MTQIHCDSCGLIWLKPHSKRLCALAKALKEDKIELVLAQDVHGYWDLSALHKNAGVLSTLRPRWARPSGIPSVMDGVDVIVDGKLAKTPKSGLARRVKR